MRNRYILSPFFLGERLSGLGELLEEKWWVNDPLPEGAEPSELMMAVHEGLAEAVRGSVGRGERPVSLAGDCCTALAMLAGLQRAGFEPSLLWFDAHGDFNTPDTSPSGFLGGMPLAILVGRGDKTLREALGLVPFPEERVVLADARALDSGERRLLSDSKVTHLPGVATWLERALPEGPLWVHLDADVVDRRESPGHRYAEDGGPSSSMVRKVFRRIAESNRLVAVSISSWDPSLDGDGMSRRVTMSLVETLVGG